MPAVFVHGNPETAAVWDPLLAELEDAGAARADLIRLSPPGFGAPVPAGFGATVGEYRDWLVDELARIPGPVDLVGHDWGGGHVLNAVMSRPDLVRSWVSDAIGIFDADYVWHELAQRWQTPGVGEADVAARFSAPVAERAATLVERGMSEDVAARVARGQDAVMGRAVLALYRSAVQPVMADLGRDLERAAQRPGLAVLATEDHVGGTVEQRRRAARRAGARVETLDGLGHWWMTRDPGRGARALTGFWASLDG
jgi:pimeloyl-ACP methyl ester carboxylesterase